MSERSVRHSGAPIWGIFLLVIGVVLLLQTLDVLPWGLWGTLWRYWPVIIIVIGIAILLRHQNVWLVSLIAFVLIAGAAGIAVWRNGVPPPGVTISNFAQPAGFVTKSDVAIDFNAGTLNIGSLASGSGNLVEADSEVRDNQKTMQADFQQHGDTGNLTMKTVNLHDNGANWTVNLNADLPTKLDIKAAAASVKADMQKLKVSNLNLEISAGSYNVTVPATAGTVQATIKTSVGNIDVTIPQGVAARITTTASLGSIGIETGRFMQSQQNGEYKSVDFDTAVNRIDLNLDATLGRISVH